MPAPHDESVRASLARKELAATTLVGALWECGWECGCCKVPPAYLNHLYCMLHINSYEIFAGAGMAGRTALSLGGCRDGATYPHGDCSPWDKTASLAIYRGSYHELCSA